MLKAVANVEATTDGSTSIEVLLHPTLLVIASRRVSVVSYGGIFRIIFLNSHAPCPP
jgi:hypothetical protein